jgi:hypothetical protein
MRTVDVAHGVGDASAIGPKSHAAMSRKSVDVVVVCGYPLALGVTVFGRRDQVLVATHQAVKRRNYEVC